MSPVAYKPKEGIAFNPLKRGKYRNIPCPCGSGRKAKKCHGLEPFMKAEAAKEAQDILNIREKAGVLRQPCDEEKKK